MFEVKKSSYILKDLLKKPPKVKREGNFNQYSKPNSTHQMDLLFLPTDPTGNKYLLVVTDLMTRLADFEPLKTKSSLQVIQALKNIYQRKILKQPFIIQVDDGSEFKGDFTKWAEKENIKIRRALPQRHNSQGVVESLNRQIGKALNIAMLRQELNTGKRNTEWVHYLADLRKYLNKKRKREVPKENPEKKEIKIICPKNKCVFLKIGEKVRRKLDYPINPITGEKLHGKFREGDIRYSLKVYTIGDIILSNNSPPMYKLEELPGTLFHKQQLLPIFELRSGEFHPLRLRNKRKVKGKLQYLVEWKHYPHPDDWTWESKNTLKDHQQLMDLTAGSVV